MGLAKIGIRSKQTLYQGPAPARSWNADAELILDSGERFCVHSLLLESSSNILVEALSAARDREHVPGERVGLCVPGISGMQAVHFVQMLYSICTHGTPSWLKTKSCTELHELAAVCHALACKKLLSLVDSALVELADITAAEVLQTYKQAQLYDLKGLQEKSTQSLLHVLPQLKLPADKDVAAGDQLHVTVLKEAQRLQTDQAAALNKLAQLLEDIKLPDDSALQAMLQALALLKSKQQRYADSGK